MNTGPVELQATVVSHGQAAGAEVARRLGDRYWERGFRFTAAFAYLAAIELSPTTEMYGAASPRLEELEGGFIRTQLAYVRALVDGDADGLVDAAASLDAAGLPGPAIASLNRAIELYGADAERVARAQRQLNAMKSTDRGAGYDPLRYRAQPVNLTAREREIAALLGRGMSNRAIAEDLVLSVRTVETHVYRLMAKLNVAKRGDLASRLSDIAVDNP
jgi:DNA-binding CsgD family transcriptional regulator